MGAVGSLVCVQGSVAIHLLDGGGMGGWGGVGVVGGGVGSEWRCNGASRGCIEGRKGVELCV